MSDDWTDEDVARLQRRRAAQKAGVDLERDMCAHDYINGIDCKDCMRHSRELMLLWLVVAVAVVVFAYQVIA